MMRATFKRGFTMIELLVVIVIIGVLAAVMVPAVSSFLDSGDDAVSRNNLMRLGRAVITYRAENKNCYPAAGGYFSSFSYRENGRREQRYGRSRGWVYFEHSCPRSAGDMDAANSIGDGNHNSYGFGTIEEDGSVTGTEVNDQGCCLCYDTRTEEGGINAKPASWYGSPDGQWSQGQTAIVNGALYEYVGQDLKVYSNPSFEKLAQTKVRVPKTQICRAYAMNVMTGADHDLYETGNGRECYATGGTGGGGDGTPCASCGSLQAHSAIRLGSSKLLAWIDNDTREEALPSKTALIVELDLDNENIRSANDLSGDQVWDWDNGNESMGFVHEDDGMYYAHVCFADGHVDAIRDPSRDPMSPDMDRRRKLSKWYGSGGLSADGEKLD